MKKLLLMFAVLGVLLTACQKEPAMQQNPQEEPAVEAQQPAQEKQQAPTMDEKWLTFEVFDTNSMPDNTPMPAAHLIPAQEEPCAIDGHDCLEIIARLPLTKEVPATEAGEKGETAYWNEPGGVKYVNPALEALGMKVTQYMEDRNGQVLQVIDDKVGITTNLGFKYSPKYGEVTVKFKDGKSFLYKLAEPVAAEEAVQPASDQPAAVPAAQKAVKPEAAPAEQQAACTIKGHDCWEVAQKLSGTREIRTPKENPTEEESLWTPDVITYENPEIEALGMKVTFYTMYRDGGSTQYVLDDEVAIRTNNSLAAEASQLGTKTIKFKDGPTFVYSPDGVLKSVEQK